MRSIKVSIIAVVAALTPLLALALDQEGASNPELQTVECKDENAPVPVTASASNREDEKASETVTVSVPNSTVNFVCPLTYTFDPPVTKVDGGPKVYSGIPCEKMEPLASYCPTAKLVAVEAGEDGVSKPGATLTVRELPADKTAVFYVQCTPTKGAMPAKGDNGEAKAPCVVKVTVNQAPKTGVNICKKPSITVNVPDKDSSVQFSCEKPFKLYPADPAKVFKDDCKTVEPLKDMTRTAPAADAAPARAGAGTPSADAAAPPVYTLKAVKKPPKKKMCYLCAAQEPTDTGAKPPGEYCAIYVESSARAKPFGFGFTLVALILSSVLAMLRLT